MKELWKGFLCFLIAGLAWLRWKLVRLFTNLIWGLGNYAMGLDENEYSDYHVTLETMLKNEKNIFYSDGNVTEN